jgi:hypothetical protein
MNAMKLRWLIPFAVLLPIRLHAAEPVAARVATVVINPGHVTPIHLRPEFVSAIRMPEDISSVDLGSRGSFTAEHSEGEPQYVYVKPITDAPAQSNLLIVTKSGQRVSLELISDGVAGNAGKQPVDFLLEYRTPRSFLVAPMTSIATPVSVPTGKASVLESSDSLSNAASANSSAIDAEFGQQVRVNAPSWTKWNGNQIETSIGDIRQWSNETVVSYSIFNPSDQPVEIMPPQISITGRKVDKKKKKQGKGIISDQLEIRDFRLSTTRLEAGGRADGIVLFDRPNFKESTEKLFLQLAQADQVDHPILISLPFTPPISAGKH